MGYVPPQQPQQPIQPRVAPPMGGGPQGAQPGFPPPGQPMQPMPQGPAFPQPGMPGMGPRPMGPGVPGAPRGIVRRNPNAGGGYWGLRMTRIWRGIKDGPYRSLGIVASSALGITIAVAIIGTSNGIQERISKVANPLNQVQPGAFNTIQDVLSKTTSLLTILSVAFTAAIVGLVTLICTGQRRRTLSLQVQQGESKANLIVELLGESFILCMGGGLIGMILGEVICSILPTLINNLPMDANLSSVFPIFPTTTILAFAVTAGIVAYYTSHTDTRTSLS